MQLKRAEIKDTVIPQVQILSLSNQNQLQESWRSSAGHETVPVYALFMALKDRPLKTGLYPTRKNH